jgi:hypothetical protein
MPGNSDRVKLAARPRHGEWWQALLASYRGNVAELG